IMKKWMVMLVAGIMTLATLSVVMADSPGNGKGPPDGVPPGHDTDVKLGVDVLLQDEIDMLEGKNVGLITNPTGVDQELNSIVDTLHNHPDVNLVSLYGPEHGVRGSEQAGTMLNFISMKEQGCLFTVCMVKRGNRHRKCWKMLMFCCLTFRMSARVFTRIFTRWLMRWKPLRKMTSSLSCLTVRIQSAASTWKGRCLTLTMNRLSDCTRFHFATA